MTSRLLIKCLLVVLILALAGFMALQMPRNPGYAPTLTTTKTGDSTSPSSPSIATGDPSDREMGGSIQTSLESLPASIHDQLEHFGETFDASAFENFLQSEEGTPFAPALLARLGEDLYAEGCYSESLALLERSWNVALGSKLEHWTEHKLLARIGARLGELYARLGRTAELDTLLDEMDGRPIEGAETLAFTNLRQALDSMREFPQHSFKCGPLALGKVYAALHPGSVSPERIASIVSPESGFSLAQVVALGGEIGLPVKAVRPGPGNIPVPSVVHWRSHHYAAITTMNEGRYLVEDATFQRSVWMSPEAIQRESSGFYIVPEDRLHPGWELATTGQAASTFGKGAPGQCDSHDQGGSADSSNCIGLPRAGFNDFYAALTLRDMPLFYKPPVGPSLEVELTYFDASNYDNATAQHGHPGKKWMLGWVRHVEVPQLNAAGATFRIVRPNGRTEMYQGTVSGGFLTFAKSGTYTASRLTVTGGVAGAPLQNIQRRLPDGSRELYGYWPDTAGNPQAFGSVVGGGTQNSKLYLAAIFDPQGNGMGFRYHSGTAKLRSIVDAIGQNTTVHYSDASDGLGADNPARRLISAIRDPFGRVVRFIYDNEERLVSLTDAAGNETTFTYAMPSRPDFVSSMTTPYGTSHFNKTESISLSTEPEHRKPIYTLTLTDPEGLQEKVSFAYVRYGSSLAGVGTASPQALSAETPATVTVANGQEWYGFLYYGVTLYWDKKTMRLYGDRTDKAHQTRWAQQTNDHVILSGIPSSRRPAMSHREWYHYEGQPNVGTIGTSALPTLRVRRITDQNGNPADEIHRYQYNPYGHLTRSIDPLGREVTMTYQSNGIDLASIQRKRGSTFETLATFSGYGHDAAFRPRYSTDAAGQTTEYRWNSRGQLTETINPLGERVVNTYDAQGYLKKVEATDPAHPADLVILNTFEYDAVGRPRRITQPDGYFVDLEYDDLNRLVKTTYPDASWESVTYEALHVASTRDRLGRETFHTYNGNMQRVSTTDPAGYTTKFEWCSCGALQVLIDAMNRRTRWHYDSMGRQIAKEYADGSRDLYRYDSTSGRLEAIIAANGKIRTRSYYLDGQIAALRHNGDTTTPDVTFSYDAADGRIKSMVDGIGSTNYSYHPVTVGTYGAGQLASEDGPLPNDVLAYSYDRLGRLAGKSLNAVAETLVFDSLGRATQVNNPLGSFGFTFAGFTGRITSMTYPGGMSASYAYHPLNGDFKLKDIIHTLGNGTQLSRHSYEHDQAGNVTRWTQVNPTAGLNRSWLCGYDDIDQLISVTAQNPSTFANLPSGNQSFTYDPAGNRLTETIDGIVTRANYNPLNQLVSQNGANAGGQPGMTYEWDSNDRLIAINYTGTTRRSEFRYDGLGRRRVVIEKDNGAITSHRRFVWDSLRLAEERDAAGTGVKRRYFGMGMQVDEGAGLQSRLFARDHLGSVRSVASGGSTVIATMNYDPWGRISSGIGTDPVSLSFTGHWYHGPSSLTMAPYRTYSPQQGRWTSRDPKGEAAGLNLLSYVRNSPARFQDVLGLDVTILGDPLSHHTFEIGQPGGKKDYFNFAPSGTTNMLLVIPSQLNPFNILNQPSVDGQFYYTPPPTNNNVLQTIKTTPETDTKILQILDELVKNKTKYPYNIFHSNCQNVPKGVLNQAFEAIGEPPPF